MLTLLTAAVIFIFATAQPKGFALTLMIGVLVSMFTAVLATRALLGLLADFVFFNKASFMGVSAAQIHAAELRLGMIGLDTSVPSRRRTARSRCRRGAGRREQ